MIWWDYPLLARRSCDDAGRRRRLPRAVRPRLRRERGGRWCVVRRPRAGKRLAPARRRVGRRRRTVERQRACHRARPGAASARASSPASAAGGRLPCALLGRRAVAARLARSPARPLRYSVAVSLRPQPRCSPALAAAALLADRTISSPRSPLLLLAVCLRAPAQRRRLYLVGACSPASASSCVTPLVASMGSHVLWSGPTVPVLGRLDVTTEELRARAVQACGWPRSRSRSPPTRCCSTTTGSSSRPASPAARCSRRPGDAARADARARRRGPRRGAARARGRGRGRARPGTAALAAARGLARARARTSPRRWRRAATAGRARRARPRRAWR